MKTIYNLTVKNGDTEIFNACYENIENAKAFSIRAMETLELPLTDFEYVKIILGSMLVSKINNYEFNIKQINLF